MKLNDNYLLGGGRGANRGSTKAQDGAIIAFFMKSSTFSLGEAKEEIITVGVTIQLDPDLEAG